MSSSEVTVRLNPLSDEWYGARAVVEEELKAIGKALERIRLSSQLQDAFTTHLLAVHRQWCEACPPAREAGLSGGGLEKESPVATSIHTQATCAAFYSPMKQKTSDRTTDIMNGLEMNAQGEVDDNNDDISETVTLVPLSRTCRVEDEESQAEVNRTLEKPSTEKVVSTQFIKVEVLEDEQIPDILPKLEDDQCNVDMDSSKEETPSQLIHEEVPLQHIGSGGQSHLERTNKVPDPLIRHERDSQGHSHLDMAGCSSEAMSHQRQVEEIPLDRSGDQFHLERTNTVSDYLIKHERDSQGHYDVDMAGSSSEAVSHQEPVEEIPLDTPDGANNTISALSGDVLSQEGVFKDPCLDSYKKVQKTSRTDGKMKKCSHCSKMYFCTHEYQKHLSTHTCQKPYQCSVCRDRFSEKEPFDTHMMQHKGDRPFECDHCSYQCSTKATLNVHLRNHTGDMPYKCSICDKRIWSKDAMKDHMSTHSGEKPFSCGICDYRCISKRQLTRHMRVHTGEKPYECSQCGKRFNQLSILNTHMIKHTKRHQCFLCGKTFSHSSHVEIHMRTHSGEKPYSCDICDFRCSQKGHLTVHRRLHTGEKPCQCSVCGKRFNHLSVLKRHMITHNGQNHHHCLVCEKTFMQSSDLKRHMMIHTGQQPHQCSLCGKRFTRLDHFKRHMETH